MCSEFIDVLGVKHLVMCCEFIAHVFGVAC